MNYQEHKAMLAAHEAGTATPEQQRAMHAHLLNLKRQHNADLREAESDARDAYRGGRSDAAAEARGCMDVWFAIQDLQARAAA